MTTAPVVLVVRGDRSARSCPNHSATRISWILFAPHWRKTVRGVRARKRRAPCLSQAGDAFRHVSRVVGFVAQAWHRAHKEGNNAET